MNDLRRLLEHADPLRHERMPAGAQRDSLRKMLDSAAAADPSAKAPVRRGAIFLCAFTLILVAATLLGPLLRPWFVTEVYAAVRFEVRLAEEQPGPGLREAKVGAAGRSIYIRDDIVVTNSDIADAHIVEDSTGSEFTIHLTFHAEGAEKLRAATQDHLGKPVAVLLDGDIVMAPVLRSPIGRSAVISGGFTRSRAESIVNGIR